MNVRRPGFARWMIVSAVVVVALLIVLGVSSQHFYLFERIDSQEVGVRFRAGRIYQVVGPGVYSDVGWFARIEKVSIEAITFTVWA